MIAFITAFITAYTVELSWGLLLSFSIPFGHVSQTSISSLNVLIDKV